MEISDETRSQIEKLCRKISVAAELDDSIQRELCDHMQDKLLGYLSGEQRVSETDALLLVKHHFGDVRAIRAMYRKVHAAESIAALARRLAAAATATLFWMSFVSVIYTLLSRAIDLDPTHHTRSSVIWLAIFIGIALMNLGGLWMTLVAWKRRADRGEQLWFLRMQPSFLAMIVIGLLAIWIALPALCGPPGRVTGMAQYVARHAIVSAGLLGWAGGFLRALAWTWFCDLSPRRPRELLASALLWALFLLASNSLGVTWWPTDPMNFNGAWQLTWIPTMLTPDGWMQVSTSAAVAAGTVLALAIVIDYGERLRRRFSHSAA